MEEVLGGTGVEDTLYKRCGYWIVLKGMVAVWEKRVREAEWYRDEGDEVKKEVSQCPPSPVQPSPAQPSPAHN